jgi:hypothetical protein
VPAAQGQDDLDDRDTAQVLTRHRHALSLRGFPLPLPRAERLDPASLGPSDVPVRRESTDLYMMARQSPPFTKPSSTDSARGSHFHRRRRRGQCRPSLRAPDVRTARTSRAGSSRAGGPAHESSQAWTSRSSARCPARARRRGRRRRDDVGVRLAQSLEAGAQVLVVDRDLTIEHEAPKIGASYADRASSSRHNS